ncbi:MAG: DUF2330 domain-containing protein [Myxococcota bacterium]|nr:DUF2330 domain-containing protein [Myxococcota bacterium]
MRRGSSIPRAPRLAALTGAAALALSLSPAPASACGGFFCDSSQPVNQAAERIIFSHGDDGTLTAVIQIQYAGPAESFAWVLPVAGSPEIGVSSNAAFARLQSATNPQYLLTTRVEGTCRDDGILRASPSDSTGGAGDAGAAATDGGAPPVTVVDSGSVGPYDYVVIAVDPAAEPASDVAVTWLQDEGFDIDDAGAERLAPYLEGGMNLLAFRLTKGNDTGSIRPVVISFGSGLASIPIRPTAVAAVDDMGVMVWVLGEHRAVPVNYMSLELNEALIDWINPSRNYGDVVTEAANQAGGQGFVTEMAGAASPLADSIFSTFERDAWNAIRARSWTGRESELLSSAVGQLGQLDGMRDVFAATVPLPTGTTLDELLACVSCYYGFDATDIDGFDPAAFLASIDTNVIAPMEATRAMFEQHSYVTRLYTTMSADEMTRDPSFDFNADLGDVSNQHDAERVIECSPSISQVDAPWRVLLPGGDTVRGSGNTWPFTVGDDDAMPANSRILRVGTSGEGEIITDNAAVISEALVDHNVTVGGPPPASTCACRVGAGGGGTGGAMLSLIALGALLVARRRRS